jgi:hypothetical protein
MDMLSMIFIAAGVVAIAATCVGDVQTLLRPAPAATGGSHAAVAWSLRVSASRSAAGLGLMMTGFTLQEPGHPLAWACMALLGLCAAVALGAYRVERRSA